LSRPGAVERAIAALRTGRAVRIEGAEPLALVSIETATPELLEIVDPKGQAPLLISGRRAVALSLANERDAADPAQPVLLAREPWLDAASAMTLADPAQDFEAVFLNSMFQNMFTGISGEGPFGGSGAVGVWRSMLTDEYSRSFAKGGGIGIADHSRLENCRVFHQGVFDFYGRYP